MVCSEYRDELEVQLAREGWLVIWANDSRMALAKVRRGWFDSVVLISTGKEMDVTETLLNLRDMRPRMPIVVVPDERNSREIRESTLPVPNTLVSSVGELNKQLKSVMESNASALAYR